MITSPKKFLFLDRGQEFQIDEYLHRPLGGSETSLLMLAKGIAELDNSAVILNSSKQNSRSFNLLQDNINLTNQFLDLADIVICNRFIDIDLINYCNLNNKQIYYYSHDAYDQEITHWLIDNNLIKKFDKILLVSNWQLETFRKYFNIDNDLIKKKFAVIHNPLDLSLFYGYVKRDLNKLIFASIPYKGIEFLDDIINDLILKTKNENLKLYVYSSMSLYNRKDQDNEYNNIFQKLSHNKNIILNTSLLSPKQLAVELMTSNLYIHPQTYHETFGMVFTQAQAAGCIPLTLNIGASKEVIYNKENILEYPNIFNTKVYNKFIDLITNKLEQTKDDQDNLYKERLKGQDFVKQFNYINIARNFLEIVNN